MKVTFTNVDGSTVEEEYASYSVQSNAKKDVHEIFLSPEVDAPEHRYRLRKVAANVEGTRIGPPTYVSAKFEDGNVYDIGVIGPTPVTVEEAEADGVLTEEEIDGLSHDDLKVELEKRNLEVPSKKSDRIEALKAAVLPKADA